MSADGAEADVALGLTLAPSAETSRRRREKRNERASGVGEIKQSSHETALALAEGRNNAPQMFARFAGNDGGPLECCRRCS